MEFAIGTPAANMRGTVAHYAARGIQILPLAGFHARMPSVGEAQNIANWAREFGPGGTFWNGRGDGHLAFKNIEFGNESSYSYQGTQGRGGEYAQRFRDAYNAVRGANPRVGLLAQADDGNCGCSTWVDAMFNAVPNLGSMVAGWTVHNYGPESRSDQRLDRAISQTARRGAPNTIGLYITEWGLATDNGRCLSDNYSWNKCMSFAQAADALRSSLSRMKSKYGSRLKELYLYQATDQRPSGQTSEREHYFGVLKRDQSDKGAFTAEARAQLRAAPAPGQ
jgi:hypothetical protein